MKTDKIKALPTGTKAILAWSAVYTVIAVVTCIYFRDVRVPFFFDAIFPNDDVEITHSEATVFYIVAYGGFIVNGLIGCRIWVNIEEVCEDVIRTNWRICINYDIWLVAAMLAAIIAGRKSIIVLIIVLWFMVPGNLTTLWRFRRLLNLVREE